jgi:hypothetical protein
MNVFNALQIKAGAKIRPHRLDNLTQPIQFIPDKEKDDEWSAWNMDFLEEQGLRQIRRNSRRLLKNYKLAKGIIDKTDYIIEDSNENADIIDILTKEDEAALELRFYPIIPNIVNVLCTEFSKRASKIMFRAVDDTSYNEMLEDKRQMIEDYTLSNARTKVATKLQEMGIEPDGEEGQSQLSDENIKSLPEIEEFFRKSYRNIVEEWATHQHAVDTERFRLAELEQNAFRDSLIADREYWHFHMMEDDYEVELWNPLFVFSFKSPDTKYVSNGNSVGKVDMLTISDVIDKYGWMMDQEQLESLESIFPARNSIYPVQGVQNDGSFYDASHTHEWNVEGPSLGMRQFNSLYRGPENLQGDIMEWLLQDSEDIVDFNNAGLLRVTTVYWKSQRKFGHLTKITENGDQIQDIVTEDYKITDKPIYNTLVYKNKTKDNLVFGEHIDWIWINEVRGGIKIGPNRSGAWRDDNKDTFNPIYLGLKGGKPGRIPFQFKGDNSLYGCKLPVEGCVFSDRNTKSVGLIDAMKPSQIGFNVVNNQIADILVDELGTVIALDQNSLPRHSMGEDWGKGNYAKAYVAMKNFQILPLDTTITNTENALNFSHYQVLNLEQTNRLLSRINLATYFKTQAFEVIGINPQRLGQQIGQATATGVEQAVQASYAQTEIYFTQHSDYLMPRVHQMRTDLAQYYNSTKPSIRLQYITSADEKINFQINGTRLLMRDFNVFAVTNNNSRNIMEQLRNLAINNNTSGASIYDLGNIIKAESIAELTGALKESEEKVLAQRQAEMAHEKEITEAQIVAQEKQRAAEMAFEAEQNELDRQKDILEAEIRAAGFGTSGDENSNGQADYLDALDRIQKQDNYTQQMNFEREKEVNKNLTKQQELALKREELATRADIAKKQLQIAKANKNKYDK